EGAAGPTSAGKKASATDPPGSAQANRPRAATASRAADSKRRTKTLASALRVSTITSGFMTFRLPHLEALRGRLARRVGPEQPQGDDDARRRVAARRGRRGRVRRDSGGARAASRPGPGHAARPAKPSSLPAAPLPGRDGRAGAGGDRDADPPAAPET